MKNPKVSICIPSYQQPELLKRTIQSVLMQTFSDYEVIITDDSEDYSIQAIVGELCHQNNIKMRYYKNPIRKGSPANWNETLRYAKGQYIKILHHDDWFAREDSLEKFVDLLDRNPQADFAFSACRVCDVGGQLQFVHMPKKSQLEGLVLNPEYLFPHNFIGAPSATIFRNSLKTKFDEQLKWVVDMDFYIKLLRRNPKFVFSEYPLVCTTNGGAHQVTVECQDNRELELFEWIYLYSNLENRLNIRSLTFIWNLFKRLKVVKKDVDNMNISRVLAWELNFIVMLQIARFRIW